MTSTSQPSPASCGTSQCATSEPVTGEPVTNQPGAGQVGVGQVGVGQVGVGQVGVGQVGGGRPAQVRTLLRSEEFTCPSCVAKIEKQVRRLPGVSAVAVHFATGRIEVEHDPQRVLVQDLVAAVERAGYRARPAAW
jgi:copper chaperone CopZ